MKKNSINYKNKYLLKNIGLFTIGTFIPKVIIFAMVPLYTNCLSTNEYGTADLLTNTVSLLMPILSLQIQDAVMKYSLNRKEKKSNVLNNGLFIASIGALLLFIFLVFAHLFVLFKLSIVYSLFIFLNYYVGSLNNILSYYCRGIDKVKLITVSSILNTIITVGFNLLFLLIFKWGLTGYLLANTIGGIVRLSYLLLRDGIWHEIRIGVKDRILLKDMIFFSIPMIFSALSWWINNASDKYILSFYEGVSIVGVYAVSSKIPSILTAFGEVISKSFSISAIREFDSNDTDGFLSNSYSNISSYMVLVCSFVMLFNIIIAKILFASEFFIAWLFCPPLLLAVMFNQISLSCENILLAMGKTKVISITAVTAAIVNTTLNFILIPVLGAYGAAIATIVGFFVAWLIRYEKVRKYIRMRNNIRKEAISYLLIFFQMILAYWGNRYLALEILVFLLLCILFKNRILKFICFLKRAAIGMGGV